MKETVDISEITADEYIQAITYHLIHSEEEDPAVIVKLNVGTLRITFEPAEEEALH